MKKLKKCEKSGTFALVVIYYTQPKPTFHIPIAASLESVSYTHLCYPQLLRQIRSDRLDADTRIYLSVGENEARDQRTLALQTERMLTIANMAMSRGVRVYPYLQPEGRHCEEDWTRQTAEFLHFLWLE